MVAYAPPARRTAARLERARITPWLLLFVAAFVLRALYVLAAYGPDPKPYSDPADYDAIAWNLATGHGFSLDAAAGPYPTAFRPPLVPWLTGLLYAVTGHSFLAALLLQCVIGALVPLLLVRFGAGVFGGRVGWLAGGLAAVHPLLVFFSGYLLTETTFCATLLVALFASSEWIKTPRRGRALGAGLAWGLANLARPTAMLLPLVVAAWGWAPLGLALARRERVRQVLLLFLGTALVIGPWTVRNALSLHAFVPITTGGGRALLDSNNRVIWDDPRLRGGGLAVYAVEPYAHLFRGRDEVEVDSIARAQAVLFLREHRGEWPQMAAAKLGRFWRLRAETSGTGSWHGEGSFLARFRRAFDPLLLWSLLTWPFAVWGIARSLAGPRRWFLSLSLWVILYFMLLAVVYWGALRMRIPIEPLLVLLSAAGMLDTGQRLRARRRGWQRIDGGVSGSG